MCYLSSTPTGRRAELHTGKGMENWSLFSASQRTGHASCRSRCPTSHVEMWRGSSWTQHQNTGAQPWLNGSCWHEFSYQEVARSSSQSVSNKYMAFSLPEGEQRNTRTIKWGLESFISYFSKGHMWPEFPRMALNPVLSRSRQDGGGHMPPFPSAPATSTFYQF